MAKTKHQKLADLMQIMLVGIEEHKNKVAKQLECVQLHLYERYAILGRPLIKELTFRSMCFSHYIALKNLVPNSNLRVICQQFPMLGILLNRSAYLLSECRQSNGEGLWFIPWGVQIVLPHENQAKLERSSMQALLYGPRADENSNEIDWFESEIAADSLTYQLLTIQEYERQRITIKNNLSKDPFPHWELAKEQCRLKLERTIGYTKLFNDLINNTKRLDKLLYAPKLDQSLAEAYETILKTEQTKSCRYGQPLLGIYKGNLEKAMFENVSWSQKRQASFLVEWRRELWDKEKPQKQEKIIDRSKTKRVNGTVLPKSGRWEQCQGVDDVTAAKFLRYFIDEFIANPLNKKMGEIACVLWIMIWIAKENPSRRLTISKILQMTQGDVSSDDAEIIIDGVLQPISWGIFDLLSCLKGSGKGRRSHRLFSNLDLGGKSLERAFHEASKAIFSDRDPVQVGAFLISPHIYPGTRMSSTQRNAMRSVEPLIPLRHTHREVKSILKRYLKSS